jgi:integrase/recombinase XerD
VVNAVNSRHVIHEKLEGVYFMATLNDYFAHLEKKGLDQSTIEGHRSSINRFLAWLEKKEGGTTGGGGMSALRKAFQKHINQFKKSSGKDLQLSVGTINLTIRHLKQFYAWLLDQRLVPDNPAEEVSYIPEDRLKAKWITESQERALFAEIRLRLGNPKLYHKTIREYAIIAMMYFTGARVEEVANIKLSDFEINERSGWVLLKGKGSRQRKVNLNKTIRKVLTQYLDEYRDQLKGDYLFDSQRSKQITTRAIQHIVDGYAKRLQMDNLTCHALRHTCLHNLVKAGVPLTEVAEIAGHLKSNGLPNIEMTMRYVKPGNDEKAAAMEAISWD